MDPWPASSPASSRCSDSSHSRQPSLADKAALVLTAGCDAWRRSRDSGSVQPAGAGSRCANDAWVTIAALASQIRPPSFLRRAAVALALIFVPALAVAQQPAPVTGGETSGTGWQTEIYPVHAWLPVFDVDVRLPAVPNPPDAGGGVTVPSANVSSSFNGAAAVGFRVERRRVSVEGEFLWAGMSASATNRVARVGVDTIAGRLLGGVRVAPDLYVDGGVRRLALKMTASVLSFPTLTWKPGIWESVIGVTYRPEFGKKLRMLAQADVGGLGQ